MSAIEQFLKEVDAVWRISTTGRLPLCVIGSAALMLGADYSRGTQDADVLETEVIAGSMRDELMALAGRDSLLHKRHHLYLDLVSPGIPFLPPTPIWHQAGGALRSLESLEILVLDVTDVVVSKLKRFNANDLGDIEAMIDRGLLAHDELLSRFRAAFDAYTMDARAADLPRYVENLHRVERDLLFVEETPIDMPSWI